METTRELMIKELIKYELEFLISNEDKLEEVTEFLCNGGFSNYTNERLKDIYITKILD
jgi:hypothetical protein